MRKRIFLIVSFIIVLGFIRCSCPDTSTYIVDWKNIKLKAVKYFGTNTSDYYSWQYTTDSVFYGPTYGFNLNLVSNVGLSEKSLLKVDFSNAAYALKCNEDYFMLRKKAIDFSIENLKDFDQEHPANSIITEYFTDEFMPKEYVLNLLNETYSGGYSESRFTLRLHEVPTLDSLHQFRINITLEDSTILTGLTQSIKLLP